MQKIIAIVGPTASGKTVLGISLAKEFDGEIVSADSRQILNGMEILSGAPTKRETKKISYHLINFADPKKQFSAGTFVKCGEKIIQEIYSRGNIPIVVGGTGFYAEALLGDTLLPEVAPNAKLRRELSKKSAEELFTILKKIDSRRGKDIDPKNRVRLIRAIEIATALGDVPPLKKSSKKYEVLWLGVSLNEKILRENIRARVLSRMKKGMVAEVQKLRVRLSKKRFSELGAEFSLLADFLDKKISKTELQEKLANWEQRYAKRQLRFLRRNEKIIWIKNQTEALGLVKKFLKS